MRTRAFVLGCGAAILAASPGFGAEDFADGVPVELVRYVSGGGDMYLDLPDDFPPFEPPPAMQVLGAKRQAVYFESTLGPRESERRLAAAFLAQDGWTRMENPSALGRPDGGGFISAGRTGDAGQPRIELCHDAHGRLTIDGDYLGEVVLLRLYAPDQRGLSCAGMEQQRAQRAARFSGGVRGHMPTLVIPAGAETTGSHRGGGSDRREMDTTLDAPDVSSAALNQHFSNQLAELGWQQDSRWEGESGAGSHWLRSVDDELPLRGWLQVIALSDTVYRVSFEAMVRPAGGL